MATEQNSSSWTPQPGSSQSPSTFFPSATVSSCSSPPTLLIPSSQTQTDSNVSSTTPQDDQATISSATSSPSEFVTPPPQAISVVTPDNISTTSATQPTLTIVSNSGQFPMVIPATSPLPMSIPDVNLLAPTPWLAQKFDSLAQFGLLFVPGMAGQPIPTTVSTTGSSVKCTNMHRSSPLYPETPRPHVSSSSTSSFKNNNDSVKIEKSKSIQQQSQQQQQQQQHPVQQDPKQPLLSMPLTQSLTPSSSNASFKFPRRHPSDIASNQLPRRGSSQNHAAIDASGTTGGMGIQCINEHPNDIPPQSLSTITSTSSQPRTTAATTVTATPPDSVLLPADDSHSNLTYRQQYDSNPSITHQQQQQQQRQYTQPSQFSQQVLVDPSASVHDDHFNPPSTPYSHSERCNTSFTHNWMQYIPDSAKLSEITLPGSHDTAAITQFDSEKDIYFKCNHMNIRQQLFSGLRVFDIRCKRVNNAWHLYHGSHSQHLSFDQVIEDCRYFLELYPSETIVMFIKEEGSARNSTKTMEELFQEAYFKYTVSVPHLTTKTTSRSTTTTTQRVTRDSNHNRPLFWIQDDVPTLGQIRGHIVLFRRFTLDSKPVISFGPSSTPLYGKPLQARGVSLSPLPSPALIGMSVDRPQITTSIGNGSASTTTTFAPQQSTIPSLQLPLQSLQTTPSGNGAPLPMSRSARLARLAAAKENTTQEPPPVASSSSLVIQDNNITHTHSTNPTDEDTLRPPEIQHQTSIQQQEHQLRSLQQSIQIQHNAASQSVQPGSTGTTGTALPRNVFRLGTGYHSDVPVTAATTTTTVNSSLYPATTAMTSQSISFNSNPARSSIIGTDISATTAPSDTSSSLALGIDFVHEWPQNNSAMCHRHSLVSSQRYNVLIQDRFDCDVNEKIQLTKEYLMYHHTLIHPTTMSTLIQQTVSPSVSASSSTSTSLQLTSPQPDSNTDELNNAATATAATTAYDYNHNQTPTRDFNYQQQQQQQQLQPQTYAQPHTYQQPPPYQPYGSNTNTGPVQNSNSINPSDHEHQQPSPYYLSYHKTLRLGETQHITDTPLSIHFFSIKGEVVLGFSRSTPHQHAEVIIPRIQQWLHHWVLSWYQQLESFLIEPRKQHKKHNNKQDSFQDHPVATRALVGHDECLAQSDGIKSLNNIDNSQRGGLPPLNESTQSSKLDPSLNYVLTSAPSNPTPPAQSYISYLGLGFATTATETNTTPQTTVPTSSSTYQQQQQFLSNTILPPFPRCPPLFPTELMHSFSPTNNALLSQIVQFRVELYPNNPYAQLYTLGYSPYTTFGVILLDYARQGFIIDLIMTNFLLDPRVQEAYLLTSFHVCDCIEQRSQLRTDLEQLLNKHNEAIQSSITSPVSSD